MLHAVLILNSSGTPRLTKFYTDLTKTHQKEIIHDLHQLVSCRSPEMCNFLQIPPNCVYFPSDVQLIYRKYATLSFIFAADSSENELGILDLIQVFVQALDDRYQNVCELDLIFNSLEIHHILDEIVLGGLVLETNLNQINKSVQEMDQFQSSTKRTSL